MNNIREKKSFLQKHHYYMSKERKVYFYFLSFAISLFLSITLEVMYRILNYYYVYTDLVYNVKNYILYGIIFLFGIWILYHLHKTIKNKERFKKEREIITWYERYKTNRSGWFKGKDPKTIIIRKKIMYYDSYRDRKTLRIIGDAKNNEVVDVYTYEENIYPYILEGMEVKMQIKDGMGYHIQLKK